MRIQVLLAMFGVTLLLGIGNNLFNPHKVDWVGSPEVLPKPEGWPTLTLAQGVAGGVMTAIKEVAQHPAIDAATLLILAGVLLAARRRHKPMGNAVKTWLRLGLGVMFLAAAWPKFWDPKDFAMLVAQYQLLPSFAVNAFSFLLPAGEITAGLAILLTPFEREATSAVGVLLLMFVVALGQALHRNLGIACGCFDIEGAADAGETWFALLRDIVLMVPVTWMWVKARRRFPWDF